jgi:hypothetical protein
MKFWRIFAAAAVVGMLLPATPAVADDDDDDDDMGGPGLNCFKDTNKVLRSDLVMCNAMQDDTQVSFGNGFPWENSTFFFSSYRNQFLYPSSTVSETAALACTIESIQSRASSFSGASTNVYAAGSYTDVGDAVSSSLVKTFALNTGTAGTYGRIDGPYTIDSTTGANGALLSTYTGALGDAWILPIDIENNAPNILVDGNSIVGTGNSGAGVWDMTTTQFGQGCSGPERAYGSGSFANSYHVTTAIGIDDANFVWVFSGLAAAPPATVEQQIKEIIRLLLTPEGLRCSGLDLNGGNGKIQDDPITFPNGANWDPIQPQVSSGGSITGDELVDGLRNAGFRAP